MNPVDGNPIIIASGTKIETATDFAMQSGSMALRRTYRSLLGTLEVNSETPRGLGYGWRFDFGLELQLQSKFYDQLSVLTPNGASYAMRRQPDGRIKPVDVDASAVELLVEYDGDWPASVEGFNRAQTSWIVREPSGRTYYVKTFPTYNDPSFRIGRPIRIVEPNGDELELVYDEKGLLQVIVDQYGQVMEFTWLIYNSGVNNDPPVPVGIRRVDLPDGTAIRYSYEAASSATASTPDRLSKVEKLDASDAITETTVYHYEDARLPYALTGVSDGRGVRYSTFAYNGEGYATLSKHAGDVDAITITYDDTLSDTKRIVTNALGKQTVYHYQRYGLYKNGLRLVSVDGEASANCVASSRSIGYDADGHMASRTDEEGRVTSYVNNARGLPISVTDGFGTAAARNTTVSYHPVLAAPTQIVTPGLTTDVTYSSDNRIASITQTDTTEHSVPYSTNGQTRSWVFNYSTLGVPPVLPSPPQPPLTEVPVPMINPDADTGDTSGWTNEYGLLAVRTAAPCDVSPCFFGGDSYDVVAGQDVSLPTSTFAEIDAGERALRVRWKQGSQEVLDAGAISLVFYNANGDQLTTATSPLRAVLQWTQRELLAPVPVGARSVRVRIHQRRDTRNVTDTYVDDIALTMVSNGERSVDPFLTMVNPDASSGIAGWTVETGSFAVVSRTYSTLTPTRCGTFECFYGDTGTLTRAYQDVALPASRLAEIDAGERRLELTWLQASRSGEDDPGEVEVEFLDGAGVAIGNPVTSGQAAPWVHEKRQLIVDIPAGARSVRVRMVMTHTPFRSSGIDAYFTAFTAQLTSRPQAHGQPRQFVALTSVDGPLPSTADTITYEYDEYGRVTKVTNELGHETLITAVNGRGQPLSITDANGVVTDLAYDAAGRLITTTVNPGPSERVTTIGYDAIGQVTSVTLPDGSSLAYTYSDARRLTSVTTGDGEKLEYTHDNMGNVTGRTIKTSGGAIVFTQTAAFDELGRLLRSIGAASQTTVYAYDKTGNLVQVTDPRSNLYGFAYDSLNRLIRETDEESGEVNLTRDGQDNVVGYNDPRSLDTSYVRNGFGDVIREINPDAGTTDSVVNALGLVTQQTDARGVVVDYSYDAAGRLIAKSFPATPAENVTYAYDDVSGGNFGKGRLTSVSDQSGSTAFTYDAFGQVVQEVRTVGAQAHTVGYAYDAAGRLAAMTYPSGRSVTYARDGQGRITSVSTRKDSLSPLEDLAVNIAWQPFGPLQSLDYGNGLTLWKTFDQDYRLDRLLVEDTGVSPSVLLLDRTHGYQDDMNLTHIWDGLNTAHDQTFWYTATNRLQNASGAYGALTFYYDANGNRTHRIVDQGGGAPETKVFSYPSTNNLLFDVETNSVVTRTFAHDAAGNMSADTRGAVAYQYGYNANNRLESVSTGGLLKGTYVYNAFEQLVSRTRVNMSPAGTIHLIHDRDGNVIAETDGAGNTVREYVWLAQNDGDIPLPLAVIADVNTASPKTYFVHADHLHRPVLMTDASKQVVWSASYLPFGGEYQISGPASLDARFPGQWFQLESGLAYNWHRHYDPSLGRYTQPDPLGFVDGPSRYAYAVNSPQVKVDKNGLVSAGRKQYCESLKKKIENISKKIEKRTDDYDANPLNLPERIGPGEALRDTKRGHQTLINKDWRQREKLQKEYDKKCSDDDDEGGTCDACGAVGVAIGIAGICAVCIAAPEVCALGVLGGAIYGGTQ